MTGEPSRLDRLQIRLNLMRQTVRELEEQIERERNPAARHKRPKLTVIKGGLSAFAGPFVVAGQLARDNAAATAAAALIVSAPAGVALITETAPPADAGQAISSLQAPHGGAASPGGDLGGSAISAVSPGSETLPPGVPTPAPTPTPASTSALAAAQIMPPAEPVVTPSELFPSLEPLPTPSVTVEPEPEPTPEPSPEPTGTEPALDPPKNAGQAHVEAVDACLAQKATVKMQDCLAALVS